MTSAPPLHERDPIRWTVALTLLFGLFAAIRLTTPHSFYFDEVHYLPAARTILELSHPINPEHPPLAKQLIALGMALFGDKALGWRIMPLLFGTTALFAAMRLMWFAGQRRFATLATGVLLATGFPLFVNSRIAMLDMFMLSFLLVGLWQFAAACRENETARWRLAITGLSLGAAMACKWNAIPVAVLPGLYFLVVRLWSAKWRFLWCRRGTPIGGISLIEAALWLGLLPVMVYVASYWPYLFYAKGAVQPTLGAFLEIQQHALDLQHKLLRKHPYQTHWWQWVSNTRGIWYLFEKVDGAQRGIVLIGNPLTFLLGLPALLWCAFLAVAKRRIDAAAMVLLYAVSLGLWIVAAKNVQFFYHYMLPSCFLLGALGIALDSLWRRGGRVAWLPLLVLAASVGLFAFFWPILSAGPLESVGEYGKWMWLRTWR